MITETTLNPIASQNICAACEREIRHGLGRLESVPGLIKRIIEEEMWRERKLPNGEIVKHNSFRELVVSEYPGWNKTTEEIVRLEDIIAERDDEVLRLWQKAMWGTCDDDDDGLPETATVVERLTYWLDKCSAEERRAFLAHIDSEPLTTKAK